ncbi:hypothetical protein ACPOLB_27335 (plasmid) [Rubrivivax sp. RP6-9]|uniref:hypothetical protein n=1 Tax=Rubrivivax sp. RP6-9 TaxID=3415750 RepID=UPI003CC69059
MKEAIQHPSTTNPRASAKTRPSNPQPPSYVPAAEVRSLLANSLAARQQRLGAADMISTDEAAQLVQTTRVTINAWIAKGRAIGLTQTKRGFRMPRWQFEPSVWAALPKLSAALGTAEGWALLSFLESPHGALNGITPRQAIEQGQMDTVIRIAEHEGN